MKVEAISVSELTKRIKLILEGNFETIWVEGEISNYIKHTSGHIYFSLKDSESQISCVFFKYQNAYLRFVPKEGMKVLVKGKVSVYGQKGQYQLVVSSMQPLGIGDLQLALEELKRKLANEGLFAEEHKKELPLFPNRIGVVTSPTGAVIRDIINIISRRFPNVELILRPVKVQGEGAEEEIVQGIKELNEFSKLNESERIDVIIVGRGGGSLEDLWAFNTEIVARAIYDSQIPIISAVGHEVDYTIADLVADVRAPTPSAAAELAVRDKNELLSYIYSLSKQIYDLTIEIIETNKKKVQSLVNSYAFRTPIDKIRQYSQKIDEMEHLLNLHINRIIEDKKKQLLTLNSQLSTLNPLNVLARGYSLCYKLPDRKLIKSVEDLNEGDKIEVKFQKGSVECNVEKKNEDN